MWWMALGVILSNVPVAAVTMFVWRRASSKDESTDSLLKKRIRFYLSAMLFFMLGVQVACLIGMIDPLYLVFGMLVSLLLIPWGITIGWVVFGKERGMYLDLGRRTTDKPKTRH